MSAAAAAQVIPFASVPTWARKPLAFRERVIVLGTTGTGKSTWARQLLSYQPRSLVYETGRVPDYPGPRFTVSNLVEEPGLILATPRLVLTPEDDSDAGLAEEVAVLLEVVREAQQATRAWPERQRTLVLCLEEVGDYCLGAAQDLGRLARNGRHDWIACVLVTQAAVEIPKSARRQATRIVSFSQTDPADLKALEERCGESFTETVRAWRKGRPPAVWSLPALKE